MMITQRRTTMQAKALQLTLYLSLFVSCLTSMSCTSASPQLATGAQVSAACDNLLELNRQQYPESAEKKDDMKNACQSLVSPHCKATDVAAIQNAQTLDSAMAPFSCINTSGYSSEDRNLSSNACCIGCGLLCSLCSWACDHL
jgi:hypothetical protein